MQDIFKVHWCFRPVCLERVKIKSTRFQPLIRLGMGDIIHPLQPTFNCESGSASVYCNSMYLLLNCKFLAFRIFVILKTKLHYIYWETSALKKVTKKCTTNPYFFVIISYTASQRNNYLKKNMDQISWYKIFLNSVRRVFCLK